MKARTVSEINWDSFPLLRIALPRFVESLRHRTYVQVEYPPDRNIKDCTCTALL